jgi:hypothetical protein
MRCVRPLGCKCICASRTQVARLTGFCVHKADGIIVADLTLVFWFQLLAAKTDQNVSIIAELLFCEEAVFDGRAA